MSTPADHEQREFIEDAPDDGLFTRVKRGYVEEEWPPLVKAERAPLLIGSMVVYLLPAVVAAEIFLDFMVALLATTAYVAVIIGAILGLTKLSRRFVTAFAVFGFSFTWSYLIVVAFFMTQLNTTRLGIAFSALTIAVLVLMLYLSAVEVLRAIRRR